MSQELSVISIASVFRCTSSLVRYIALMVLISSRTVGICRSRCMTWFAMYHGAWVMALGVLDWNLCSIYIFALLAVPQSCTLYAQMGFRIALYTNRLGSVAWFTLCHAVFSFGKYVFSNWVFYSGGNLRI